ncbi:unnamed protein product [Albugo candida]|uniref:Uncharacterized protein n=1 Tax=Albugo candida TaxID=65357 RepID=A0A024GDZ1_9STRA|nr:unnamed protein product [Albugo candida]|eukprot:CCI45096.1 unnamed protein product [Albugo candida]
MVCKMQQMRWSLKRATFVLILDCVLRRYGDQSNWLCYFYCSLITNITSRRLTKISELGLVVHSGGKQVKYSSNPLIASTSTLFTSIFRPRGPIAIHEFAMSTFNYNFTCITIESVVWLGIFAHFLQVARISDCNQESARREGKEVNSIRLILVSLYFLRYHWLPLRRDTRCKNLTRLEAPCLNKVMCEPKDRRFCSSFLYSDSM